MTSLRNKKQLFWHPQSPHVKALQAELVCAAVAAFRDEISAAHGVGGSGREGSGDRQCVRGMGRRVENETKDMAPDLRQSIASDSKEGTNPGLKKGTGSELKDMGPQMNVPVIVCGDWNSVPDMQVML